MSYQAPETPKKREAPHFEVWFDSRVTRIDFSIWHCILVMYNMVAEKMLRLGLWILSVWGQVFFTFHVISGV